MKRPGIDALLTASCDLETVAQHDEHTARGLSELAEPDPELAQYYTQRAVELRAVAAWIDALRLDETERARHRCTAGRAHRVRDVEDQGDGITVERCRCGAARVRMRDAQIDEVTDWEHHAAVDPSPSRARSDPSAGA